MVVAFDADGEGLDRKVIPPERLSVEGVSPGDKRLINQLLCHDLTEWE